MPTSRKPTSPRTSSGFLTPVVKTTENKVTTEEPKVEEMIVTPEPKSEPVIIKEVPIEVPVIVHPPVTPVSVTPPQKEPVKTPKVVKHPRNQPRFSLHK
jgi:hypothetical protein